MACIQREWHVYNACAGVHLECRWNVNGYGFWLHSFEQLNGRLFITVDSNGNRLERPPNCTSYSDNAWYIATTESPSNREFG